MCLLLVLSGLESPHGLAALHSERRTSKPSCFDSLELLYKVAVLTVGWPGLASGFVHHKVSVWVGVSEVLAHGMPTLLLLGQW